MYELLRNWACWLIVIPFSASAALAQERLWDLRIDDPVDGWSRATGAIVDAQGNTYAAGVNLQSWVAWKVDPAGNLLWTWNEGLWSSSLQAQLRIALLDNGDLLIAGMGGGKFSIARLSSEGQLVFRRSDPAIPGWELATQLHIAPDGSLVLVTTRNSAAVIRNYDRDGVPRWEYVHSSRNSRYDSGNAVWVAENGDIYAGITSKLQPNSDDTDIVVLRLSPAGELRYMQRVSPPASQRNIVQRLIVDEGERVFVFGIRQRPGYLSMPLTLMLSPQGEVVWQDIVDFPGVNTEIQTTAWDRDNHRVYVGGSKRDPVSGIGELFLAQFETAGRSWVATSGDGVGYPKMARLALSPDGSVRTIGNVPRQNLERPMVVQHYSPAGALLDEWQYSSGNYGGDFIWAVALQPSGDIEAVTSGSQLTRFDSVGAPQWTTILTSQIGRDEYVPGAVRDGAGGLYVLSENVWDDGLLTRINAEGSVLWRRWLVPSGRSGPRNLALDSAGRVVVSTLASGGDAYFDPAIMRFSPNGELLNDTRCPAWPGGPDYVSEPVLDAQDNVYVSVTSEQFNQYGSSTYHNRLDKIDADGSIVWSVDRQRGDISVNGAEMVTLVTTFYPPRVPPNPQPPSELVVYRHGPNGALVWERRWPLPGRSTYGAAGITLEDGSAFVLGAAAANSSLPGFFVMLHYSSSGELLWGRQFGEEIAGSIRVTKIRMTNDGDLIILGSHAIGEGSQPRNPILAKLSAAGELLWVQSYTGLSGDETPSDLYVNDDGMIYIAGGYAGSAENSYPYGLRFDETGVLHWRTTKIEPQFGNTYRSIVPRPDGGYFLVGNGYDVLSRWDVIISRFGPAPAACVPGNRCQGDVNGDCVVGIDDLVGVLSAFGKVPTGGESPSNGDLTIDGQVTLEDLAVVLSSFGVRCQ